MSKKFYLLVIIIVILFTPFFVVHAQYGIDVTADQTPITNFKGASLQTMIGELLGAVLSLVGILFFALMVYGGVVWMSAAGNQEREKKAGGIMIGATIGVVIVLSSYVLVGFLFSNVGQNLNTPSSSSSSVTDIDSPKIVSPCKKHNPNWSCQKLTACGLSDYNALGVGPGMNWIKSKCDANDEICCTAIEGDGEKPKEDEDDGTEPKTLGLCEQHNPNWSCQKLTACGLSDYNALGVGPGTNWIKNKCDANDEICCTATEGGSEATCKAKASEKLSEKCQSNSALAPSKACGEVSPISLLDFDVELWCSGESGSCVYSGPDSDLCQTLDEFDCPNAEEICEYK
ncbi:MAG: hypothetical protein HOA57_01320 [Candidatus Magasanikbacteria bacterium]|jgi:hypothetical protein|nr:hypothetical protein [Candidatus Magasanikbacteria bacterium]MBT4315061.1 hypothetical protein [Candidatus Magasanikbacteria bacterium]MBT4546840.1 hypothetical protein [Candidatus Magasanikbacteria bacterium]MBT6819005.1 hypothetical protein [Candidatus Magasanikbacteria bacterium]